MKKTLLQKAKEVKLKTAFRKSIDDEQIELAIGWMKDEISITQMSKVLNWKVSGGTRSTVASWLREGYRRGKIKVIK